jgi:multiple sugar transport system ATP-binding protein
VDCTLQDGHISLGEGARFEVPAALAERAQAASRLTFGIRPEDIALAPAGGSAPVPARVVLSEPLGAETLVTFQVGGCELVARCSASFNLKPTTPVTVHLAQRCMHLFDAASGQALR